MIGHGFAFVARRDPDFAPAVVAAQRLVVKIQSELAKLPEVIGNVFPCIHYRPVRPHNDLIRIVFLVAFSSFPFLSLSRSFFSFHHPASLAATFGLENDRARSFQLFKSVRPEMKMQNLLFARQQVIADVKTRHRVQMVIDLLRFREALLRGFQAAIYLPRTRRRRGNTGPSSSNRSSLLVSQRAFRPML